MYHLQHVIFSGGGTGGHLFPGLAVAAELQHGGTAPRITFAGCGREFEQRHVEAAGFEYLPITCSPWPRRAWRLPGFALEHLAAVRTAERFLRSCGADVVVGLGGYASVPMARAALSSGVPLVLLEQNAVAGRANRWLAAEAQTVCTSFGETWKSLPAAANVFVTGNPVRRAFVLPRQVEREKLLLVLGGSGGAADLNEQLPLALVSCRGLLAGWRIVHQSGATAADTTRAWYHRLGMDVEVVPFRDALSELLARAALAVCRGGGTTLAELAATGVPAIVCPFARAADDHQRRNAEAYAAAGACRVIDSRKQSKPLGVQLARALTEVLSDAAMRLSMSAAMRRLSRPAATARVADLVRRAAAPSAGLRAA